MLVSSIADKPLPIINSSTFNLRTYYAMIILFCWNDLKGQIGQRFYLRKSYMSTFIKYWSFLEVLTSLYVNMHK